MSQKSQNTGMASTYTELVNQDKKDGDKRLPTYWEKTVAHSGGWNGLRKGRRHGADITSGSIII
jgi:hypothetical protein